VVEVGLNRVRQKVWKQRNYWSVKIVLRDRAAGEQVAGSREQGED
jgi:hypothetical protein